MWGQPPSAVQAAQTHRAAGFSVRRAKTAKQKAPHRSEALCLKRAYGVTVSVNVSELVIGFAPPVVALRVMGYDPTGVPGLLLLPPPEVPPHEAIHSVDTPNPITNASIRAAAYDRFRALNVNTIPNNPGSSMA